MSKHRSTTSIELEIHALFLHYKSPDLTADALIKKYENEKLSLSEFSVIANFLMACGFYGSLINFIAKKLGDGSKIPWGHFAEALFRSQAILEIEIKKNILEGALEHNAWSELCRSRFLDDLEPALQTEREKRKKRVIESHQAKRMALMQEIEVLRSQGLTQEEDKALARMAILFPLDQEIANLRDSLRERLAVDIIANKPKPKSRLFIPYHESKDLETQAALDNIFEGMKKTLQSNEEPTILAEDFAVAMLTWEEEQKAAHILEKSPPSVSSDWLKAEIMLAARNFVDLLHHLTWLEATYGDDPECLFSVSYLRAQALWGLNQKVKAIDILEGMVVSRPHYRAAHSLLNQWKSELYE